MTYVQITSAEPCNHCGALLRVGDTGWETHDGVLCRHCANSYEGSAA